MKILYKNKTKYTKEGYSKFLQFHQNKFGNKYTFSTVVTILLLCFCIITNLQYYHKSVAFILLITLIIFCFYRFYHPIKLVKQELKTEKFKNEIEFTFKFYKKFFTIFDSKNLEKIQDFFYLYIDKNHAFLLDKNTFTRGDTSEFLKFIKRKIWFKI